MSDFLAADIRGDREAMAALKQMRGRQAITVLKRSLNDGGKPMLKAAKRNTPVYTGRLRASLGLETLVSKKQGEIRVRIVPRANFEFTASKRAGGGRMFVSRRKRDGTMTKRGAKWSSSGRTEDSNSPNYYAYGIEFGALPSGVRNVFGRGKKTNIARKKGGAYMLTRAFRSEARQVQPIVAKQIVHHVTKSAQKMRKTP